MSRSTFRIIHQEYFAELLIHLYPSQQTLSPGEAGKTGGGHFGQSWTTGEKKTVKLEFRICIQNQL